MWNPESIVWNPESTDFDGSQVSFLVGRVSFASRIHASASDIRDPLFQPRSQGLSSLPPLLLQRRETLGTRLPLFGIRNLMGWDLESEGHLDSFTKGERRANARNVSSQMVVMALNQESTDPEPTTLLCSCKCVFTNRFIFRLNFPRMKLPQEPDDQLQEIKLTS